MTMDEVEDSADVSRIPLGFFKPPKPISAMSDEELEAWVTSIHGQIAEAARAARQDANPADEPAPETAN